MIVTGNFKNTSLLPHTHRHEKVAATPLHRAL